MFEHRPRSGDIKTANNPAYDANTIFKSLSKRGDLGASFIKHTKLKSEGLSKYDKAEDKKVVEAKKLASSRIKAKLRELENWK